MVRRRRPRPLKSPRKAGAVMQRQGYGKIINISSGTASKGSTGMLHYVTSKAAVEGLTRSLAREMGGRSGICINAIAPGNTESEARDDLTDEIRRRVVS